jgi:hypothetical protein
MSPSRGATATKHSIAWAESTYGPAAVLRAGKRIVWLPGRKGALPRPMSQGEDLFGCGDLLCLRPGRPLLVQVTTQTASRGSVWTRRKKVQEWLERLPEYRCEASVIAWVKGKHFRCWIWQAAHERWHEGEPFWSPAETRAWEERK